GGRHRALRQPRARHRTGGGPGVRILADPLVDWSALGKVVLYSLLAGLAVPAIYSVAVVGAARSSEAARAHRSGAATAYAVLTVVCILCSIGAIAYGVYLLTQK